MKIGTFLVKFPEKNVKYMKSIQGIRTRNLCEILKSSFNNLQRKME